jgi:hypothetical protein
MLDSYSYQLMHCIHLCNYTVFTEREINAFQKLWFVEVAQAKNSQYISQCVVTRSRQNSSDSEYSWSRTALGSKWTTQQLLRLQPGRRTFFFTALL